MKKSLRRKSDMWISHNRVLVGGNKKGSGRNPNFDTEETKLLISLWGEPTLQKTLITTHKKHPVIVKLAEKMKEFGYLRTPEEINTRIKNLKCFYNRIKKDMETGIIRDPTWKHFTAMDEIMQRPIFSVRPDEIPKPSLRYKMEEEANREEEERQRIEAMEDNMESGDDDDDIDSDELFEDDSRTPDEEQEDNNEIKTNNIETSPLIIPKQEPIDIDDEIEQVDSSGREIDDSNDVFPKLSAYLQLASNKTTTNTTSSISNPSNIITTIAGSLNTDINSSMTNGMNFTQPIMFTSQSNSVTQPGKISLVPTNLLLKPQQQQQQQKHQQQQQQHLQKQQQIQIRPQTQHILYTKPSAQGINTSGAGKMPMKVLLVNTLQKAPTGQNSSTTTTDTQQNPVPATLVKTNSIPQTNNVTEKNLKNTEVQKKNSKNSSDFRSLLTQIIQIQSEKLEIEKQRLDFEKQRLEFEKSLGEKLCATIALLQPANGTVSLLKPKIEREDN